MLVIRVELHSAITGRITELARMRICNIGGTQRIGDYSGQTLRGRDKKALDMGVTQRDAEVRGHRRLDLHVWHLVAKMLMAMGYGRPLARADLELEEPRHGDA